MSDLERLDQALERWDEWDNDDHSIGERHPFYPAIQAARAYRDLLANGQRERDEPLLGLATTRELLDELRARIEVDGRLDYRTVDGE